MNDNHDPRRKDAADNAPESPKNNDPSDQERVLGSGEFIDLGGDSPENEPQQRPEKDPSSSDELVLDDSSQDQDQDRQAKDVDDKEQRDAAPEKVDVPRQPTPVPEKTEVPDAVAATPDDSDASSPAEKSDDDASAQPAPPRGSSPTIDIIFNTGVISATPEELVELFRKGIVKPGSPVYFKKRLYRANDFIPQLRQSPVPDYFLSPKPTFNPTPILIGLAVLLFIMTVAGVVWLAFIVSEKKPPVTPDQPIVVAPEDDETPDVDVDEEDATPTPDAASEEEPTDAGEESESAPSVEPQSPEDTTAPEDATAPEDVTGPEDITAPEDTTLPPIPADDETTPDDETPDVGVPVVDVPEDTTDPEDLIDDDSGFSDDTSPFDVVPEDEASSQDSVDDELETEPIEISPNVYLPIDGQAWLTAPFDANITRIPTNFRGHNFTAIRDALMRTDYQIPERRPNESDANYQSRRAAAARRAGETPLFGSVMPNSRLAFVLPNIEMVRNDSRYQTGVDYVTTTYDSPSKTLSVMKTLGGYSVSFFDGRYVAPFLLSSGAYGLAIESPLDAGFKWANSDSYCWRVSGLPSDDYERMKNTICVLAIAVLDYQGLGDTGLLGASGNFALYTRQVEFWVYDAAEGEILGKFSIDDTFDEQPSNYRFGAASPGSAARKIDKRSIDRNAIRQP